MYKFEDKDIAADLIGLARNGVKISFIVDEDQNSQNNSSMISFYF